MRIRLWFQSVTLIVLFRWLFGSLPRVHFGVLPSTVPEGIARVTEKLRSPIREQELKHGTRSAIHRKDPLTEPPQPLTYHSQ